MKKRLLTIAAILAVVVGAIVLILALLPAGPGVTKANFDRLEVGMTEYQVESLFGPAVRLQNNNKGPVCYEGWEGMALVEFNENVFLENAIWYHRPRSLMEELQRWLPWLPG